MPFYPQEKIDEINQAADLVELVSRYVVLKRAGSYYKGLCPFHTEKTPSFTVTPQRHRFHCFGCGQGGGAVRFLMLVENIGFHEALEEMARRTGVGLPAPDPARGRTEVNRAGLYQVMEKARDFYAARLWSPQGEAARAYLEERGLGRAAAKAFGLGLAPQAWDGLRGHLAKEGFGDQLAAEAGLIKAGRQPGHFYDFFRGRLMVPITDAQGRVTAFGGRVLPGGEEEGAKYINTGATPIYTKGDLLFGFQRARPFIRALGLVFLVEGYFDLISLAAAGINETVAALGTALTARQVSLLKSLAVPVYMITDGDEAGRQVPVKNLPAFLNAGLEVRVVSLPESSNSKQDPDTFVRTRGPEALRELSAEAPEIFDYWLEELKRKTPADSGGVTAQFSRLDQARELLRQLEDPAKRQIVRRRLAGMLNIAEETLGAGGRAAPPMAKTAPALAGRPEAEPAALALLDLVLLHPETAGLVLSRMADYWPRDMSRPLFDRLRSVFEARGEAGLAAVEGDDLAAPLANLVGKAALSPKGPSGRAEAPVRQQMGRLVEQWGRRRQDELSQATARAQAAGDEDEVRRLAGEKKEVAARVRAESGLIWK